MTDIVERKNKFMFQWHITDFCSNHCKHCYMETLNQQHVSLQDATRILEDIRYCCEIIDAKATLAISGGDPLMHPHFWEILKNARRSVDRLAILGNPELLNEKSVAKLKSVGISQYQLSIDGMEETHDSFRSPGSFARTVRAVEMLNKAKINVILMSTVSGVNYKEMPEIMKLAHKLKVHKWTYARYVPSSGDCGIIPEEFHEFLKTMLAEQNLLKGGETIFPVKEPLLHSITCEPDTADDEIVKSGCSLGSSIFSILPDKTMMGCRRLRGSELGRWKKKGDLLNVYLFHPKMKMYREIDRMEGCSECSYKFQCRGCRAVAHASTGSVFGLDPQCFIKQRR